MVTNFQGQAYRDRQCVITWMIGMIVLHGIATLEYIDF